MRYADLAFEGFEQKSASDDVAVFGGVASTSDRDLAGDIIEAGAFGKVIPKSIALLRDHDPRNVIGGWTQFEQDGKHLRVEGELLLTTDKGRETHQLMKRGYLSGISVGYIVKPGGSTWDEAKNSRVIRKAKLVECSIVSIPANDGARVRSVKELETPAHARDWLRDNGFMSHEIELIMTKGFNALLSDGEAPQPQDTRHKDVSEDDLSTVAAPLRDLVRAIKMRSVHV